MQISNNELLQYLPRAKVDSEDLSQYRSSTLEQSHVDLTIAQLKFYFTTEGWSNDPPSVVKQIILMRVASEIWNQHWATDDTNLSGYGQRLWTRAQNLLDMIIAGEIKVIPDQEQPGSAGYEELDEPVFQMGAIW